MKRRTFLAVALAGPPAVALFASSSDAEASVSLLATLDELVAGSTYVVVATPKERASQWEDLPSGRRIVTYTKLKIDKAIVGSPGSEITVRTLGGAVGRIGQSVSGEAQLKLDAKALLFLAKVDAITLVTGMAQGHYPIVSENGVDKLAGSPDAGELLPRRGPSISARETLLGAKLDLVTTTIQATRKALDAKK